MNNNNYLYKTILKNIKDEDIIELIENLKNNQFDTKEKYNDSKNNVLKFIFKITEILNRENISNTTKINQNNTIIDPFKFKKNIKDNIANGIAFF